MSLVDTHIHLDDPQFDPDRGEIVAAARAVGVAEMVHIGYRPDRWESSLEMLAEVDGLSCALGVHPSHAHEALDADLDRLAALAVAPGVAAIGEIGLDRYWSTDHDAAQTDWFRRQLELARALALPVIIHQRSAATGVHRELAALDPTVLIVLHSFDGDPSLASLARERGYLLGVGGLMTRAASTDLRRILADFPLDQLILETDAPYLVPTGVKRRRNGPDLLPVIAAKLAELRGTTADEVAAATTATARRRLLRTSASIPVVAK